MKKYKDFNIKTKLLVLNITLTIILMILNFALYKDIKMRISADINDKLYTLNQDISKFIDNSLMLNINSYFNNTKKSFYIFSNEHNVDDDEKLIEAYINYFAKNKSIPVIFHINKAGKTVYSNTGEKLPFHTNEMVETIVFNGRKYLTSAHKILHRDIWINTYLDYENVHKVINLEAIKSNLEIIKFGKQGYSYIVNSNKILVVHPFYQDRDITEVDKNAEIFINEVYRKKSGFIKYFWKNHDGKKKMEKVAVYRSLENLDWYVISSGYIDDFNLTLKLIARNIIVTLVLLVLFNILLYKILRDLIGKPIKELTEDIKNIGIKDKKYLEVKSEDELGIIITTFNSLLSTIENYSTNLEYMVEEKTEMLRNLNKKLYNMTIYDKLTEVHNRRYIMGFISSKFKKSQNFTIALFDIDHFKHINDNYGHIAGDYVLKELATVVKNSLDENQSFGRYGGEEFLLAFDSDEKESFAVVEKIRMAIDNHSFNYEDQIIKVSASFGISSTFTADYKSVDYLIDMADKALYFSKNNGRNKTTIYNKDID